MSTFCYTQLYNIHIHVYIHTNYLEQFLYLPISDRVDRYDGCVRRDVPIIRDTKVIVLPDGAQGVSVATGTVRTKMIENGGQARIRET